MADANEMVANATWYSVLKPGPVLAPDGSTQYAVIGMHVDLQAAVSQASAIAGSAIVLNCCLFVNPATVAAAHG